MARQTRGAARSSGSPRERKTKERGAGSEPRRWCGVRSAECAVGLQRGTRRPEDCSNPRSVLHPGGLFFSYVRQSGCCKDGFALRKQPFKIYIPSASPHKKGRLTVAPSSAQKQTARPSERPAPASPEPGGGRCARSQRHRPGGSQPAVTRKNWRCVMPATFRRSAGPKHMRKNGGTRLLCYVHKDSDTDGCLLA